MLQNVDSSIISKIKKLLDHHAGCLKINSEAEAMTAMEMARNLMKKHHLDMMMLQEQSSDIKITHKNIDKCSVYVIPVWLINIINIVNNLCNCSCILEKDPQSNGYIHTRIVFVCPESELDRVFSMYMFFKKTTYKLANLHRKRVCGNYTNWRSFAEGFTSRLLERSRITKNVEPDEKEIVESSEDEFEIIETNSEENTDLVNVEESREIQLRKYLQDVKVKINEYIDKNINNVKYEEMKTVSNVLKCSYELGRKQAENQNMTFIDKEHQLTQKGKTKK